MIHHDWNLFYDIIQWMNIIKDKLSSIVNDFDMSLSELKSSITSSAFITNYDFNVMTFDYITRSSSLSSLEEI